MEYRPQFNNKKKYSCDFHRLFCLLSTIIFDSKGWWDQNSHSLRPAWIYRDFCRVFNIPVWCYSSINWSALIRQMLFSSSKNALSVKRIFCCRICADPKRMQKELYEIYEPFIIEWKNLRNIHPQMILLTVQIYKDWLGKLNIKPYLFNILKSIEFTLWNHRLIKFIKI